MGDDAQLSDSTAVEKEYQEVKVRLNKHLASKLDVHCMGIRENRSDFIATAVAEKMGMGEHNVALGMPYRPPRAAPRPLSARL